MVRRAPVLNVLPPFGMIWLLLLWLRSQPKTPADGKTILCGWDLESKIPFSSLYMFGEKCIAMSPVPFFPEKVRNNNSLNVSLIKQKIYRCFFYIKTWPDREGVVYCYDKAMQN